MQEDVKSSSLITVSALVFLALHRIDIYQGGIIKYVVVGWRYLTGYFSIGLNNRCHGGRVPSKRESMELGHNIRVRFSWPHRRAGPVDVPEGHRITC